MNDTAGQEEGADSRLSVRRYAVAALLSAAWVVIFAMHFPGRDISPDVQPFFYPAFMYFLPLSVFYGQVLPWPVEDLRALWCMTGLDTVIAAVLCLPFLYPKGRRQDVFSILSLVILAAYTFLAFYAYLMQSY